MGDTGETRGVQRAVVLNGVPLEQVSLFKYLGSWITRVRNETNHESLLASACFREQKAENSR